MQNTQVWSHWTRSQAQNVYFGPNKQKIYFNIGNKIDESMATLANVVQNAQINLTEEKYWNLWDKKQQIWREKKHIVEFISDLIISCQSWMLGDWGQLRIIRAQIIMPNTFDRFRGYTNSTENCISEMNWTERSRAHSVQAALDSFEANINAK